MELPYCSPIEGWLRQDGRRTGRTINLTSFPPHLHGRNSNMTARQLVEVATHGTTEKKIPWAQISDRNSKSVLGQITLD